VSRGLGKQQRLFLSAIRQLEATHGQRRWFFVHGAIRAVWPALSVRAGALRPGSNVEGEVNPSRILAGLAKRGLIERNAKRGPGASIRLTDAGRMGRIS
jgi:hypothetical protein